MNEPSSKDRTAKKLTIGKELAVTELAVTGLAGGGASRETIAGSARGAWL